MINCWSCSGTEDVLLIGFRHDLAFDRPSNQCDAFSSNSLGYKHEQDGEAVHGNNMLFVECCGIFGAGKVKPCRDPDRQNYKLHVEVTLLSFDSFDSIRMVVPLLQPWIEPNEDGRERQCRWDNGADKVIARAVEVEEQPFSCAFAECRCE